MEGDSREENKKGKSLSQTCNESRFLNGIFKLIFMSYFAKCVLAKKIIFITKRSFNAITRKEQEEEEEKEDWALLDQEFHST